MGSSARATVSVSFGTGEQFTDALGPPEVSAVDVQLKEEGSGMDSSLSRAAAKSVSGPMASLGSR